jgi:hypothetical protein
VLRNEKRTNELAIRDPAYRQVLASHEHWAYDETSWRYGSEISSLTKIVNEAEARGELSVRCGIPMGSGVPNRGRWYVYDGRTVHADDGRELLYYHWGRMRHRRVQWPNPEEARKGFAFDRYGFYEPELGRARLTARRAEGRVRELASDARRRLGKWRTAIRGTLSAFALVLVCALALPMARANSERSLDPQNRLEQFSIPQRGSLNSC